MSLKEYLGDSVYVEFDGDSIILTTENGLFHPELCNGPSNVIILNGEVLFALNKFVERIKQQCNSPLTEPT